MTKLSFKDGTRNPFFKILREWESCQRCPLHERRTNVVQCRGQLPADLVFIGEAPGVSEDVLGFPFTGPAGKYLDRLIADNVPARFRVAIVNVVACIPVADSGGTRPPKKTEAKACQPRLDALLDIAKPRLLVTLGATAKRFVPERGIPVVNLTHPAAILRKSHDNPEAADLDEKRFRLTLRAGLEALGVKS